MANPMDSVFLAPGTGMRQPELMLCTVLHLMSHYTARGEGAPCIKLASVIERHLKALASLPELTPVLQATCRQLSEQWEDVVEQAMAPPRPIGSYLSRIVARCAGQAATEAARD